MDFRSFARINGVEIGDLRAGDKIHRCPTTEHPSSRNGAYFFDGYRGWVQNWETGEPPQWWNDPNAKPWNDSEKREWALRRRAAEGDKLKDQATATKKAGLLIASASRDTHPYLKAKGLVDVVALIGQAGELLVPMRDFRDNSLLGVAFGTSGNFDSTRSHPTGPWSLKWELIASTASAFEGFAITGTQSSSSGYPFVTTAGK